MRWMFSGLSMISDLPTVTVSLAGPEAFSGWAGGPISDAPTGRAESSHAKAAANRMRAI
jgi:hypothetical protein